MYLQETFTFKTRRKVTSLIASLFLLAIISGALTKEIRPCPENCQCYVDPSFLNPLNTAKCDILVWRNKTYPNIQQLKLTRASGARSCHLPHVSATLFPKLQKLNLSNCSLARIPSTEPNRFHNLDSLDLSHNRIKKILSDSFDSYPQILRIIFTNNPLYPQSPSALNSSTLVELSLDSCHIRDLLPESFSGLPKLRDLSLSNNQISEVFADTLPANLATLDLSRNQMVDVPTSELLRLKNLAELILTGNPINCTCELVRFQEWLSGKGVFFINGITCKYPHHFAGQNLSRLRADDLCDHQQLSFPSEFRPQIDEDYVNDGGVDEVQQALKNDDLLPLADEPKEADNLEGSGDDAEISASADTTVSNSASVNTSESTTMNSVTQFQNELNSASESSSSAKSNPSVDSPAAPIDSVGTTLPASPEASSSTSGTTTPLPQTSSIVASNDSPTEAPPTSDTLSTENSSTTSSDTSSVAPSAAISETTAPNSSPAPSEASPEITTPIPSPAPSEGPSETATPSTSSITPSESSPETTTPTPSPAPSESSPETTTPTPSPAPSEGSPESTTPIPSPSSTSGAPSVATSETTTPTPSPASADSTSVPPSNPSSDSAATETPEVKPTETSEKPTAKESSANVSNSTSIASSDAHTGDKKHAENSSQLYGYVVPGLAVLVTCLVVLALYCGKCASKVDAYKVAETEEEGAELQEISLLPDSNRPSIMKYSSKYPGEKENGQTEKLMSSHDQQNGGSNVGTEVNGNIAEVNGNGSQHSNETVECCKLVNGQSAANQNDLGDVECTVAKVTTLPDSVPQTAVIRDI